MISLIHPGPSASMILILTSLVELYDTCFKAQSDSIRSLVLGECACSHRMGRISAEIIA